MSAPGPLPDSGQQSQVIGRDTVRSTDAATWLFALGDIELACEKAARAELEALCEASPATVVLQFPDGAFVDLRGLAVLVDAARSLRVRGGGLLVVNAPYSLRRMVEILRIESELGIARDRSEAESWVARAGLRGQ